jgi:hypothetical protein
MVIKNNKLKEEIIAIFLLATTFTSFMVQYSAHSYRLAIEPYYDDVGYFIDAFGRLEAIYNKGLWGMINSLLVNPPHSLWSSLAATIGFAVGGISNYSPYAVNGILVFILLLVVFHYGLKVSLKAKIIVALFALSCPMTALAIIEFRPDFAANLFLVCGVSLLLASPNFESCLCRKKIAVVIILFSSALLAKVTIILASGFLMLFGIALYVVSVWSAKPLLKRRFKHACAIIAFVGVSVVWFYILNYQHISTYISDNLLGPLHRDLNKTVLLKDRLSFFINNTGGIQLDRHYWYILFLIIISVVVGVYQRHWKLLAMYTRLFLWTAAAYFGTSIIGIANHFLGLNFQIMLLVMGCIAFFNLLESARTTRSKTVTYMCSVILVFWALISGFPPKHGRYSSGEPDNINFINHRLLNKIRQTVGDLPRPVVTFLTVGLNANPETFEWLSLRHNIKATMRSNIFTQNLNETIALINSSDLIITSDLEVPALITQTGAAVQYPYVAQLAGAKEYLQSNKQFFLSERIPTMLGGSYYVFQKVRSK